MSLEKNEMSPREKHKTFKAMPGEIDINLSPYEFFLVIKVLKHYQNLIGIHAERYRDKLNEAKDDPSKKDEVNRLHSEIEDEILTFQGLYPLVRRLIPIYDNWAKN